MSEPRFQFGWLNDRRLAAHALSPTPVDAPPIEEQLAVFNLVASTRRLRAELEPFAVSPSVRRIKQLSLQEQGVLFDLLRAIDQLLPGPYVLFPDPDALVGFEAGSVERSRRGQPDV